MDPTDRNNSTEPLLYRRHKKTNRNIGSDKSEGVNERSSRSRSRRRHQNHHRSAHRRRCTNSPSSSSSSSSVSTCSSSSSYRSISRKSKSGRRHHRHKRDRKENYYESSASQSSSDEHRDRIKKKPKTEKKKRKRKRKKTRDRREHSHANESNQHELVESTTKPQNDQEKQCHPQHHNSINVLSSSHPRHPSLSLVAKRKDGKTDTLSSTTLSTTASFTAANVNINTTNSPPPLKSKGPMTHSQYLKLQSQIREVIDPHTGRKRYIRGTGEIIERIVSRQEHSQLNKCATLGDGNGYANEIMKAATASISSTNCARR